MDAALAIGRIVLVMIFIFSGLGKLFDISGTAAEITSKGLPFPQLLAVAAGIGETIGGLLIAVGWRQTRLAAAGLIVFTAVAGFLFHDFWNLPAGDEQMNQMAHAFKNLSIIGGLIVLAAPARADGRSTVEVVDEMGRGGPAYSV
jgi:putative oxidoreductase